MKTIITIILSYLLGSIPTAYILVKKIKKIDIREVGSGNVGATNALRAGGKWLGLVTFLLDFLKGFIPVFVLKYFFSQNEIYFLQPLVVGSAVFGHMTTVFLKFRGGKGVSTAIGAITAVSWECFLICITIFVITLLITRFVSLSSILASIGFVCSIFVLNRFNEYPLLSKLLFSLIAIIIIYKHKSNILRLIKGTENKIF